VITRFLIKSASQAWAASHPHDFNKASILDVEI
jgi:hypothetical protein